MHYAGCPEVLPAPNVLCLPRRQAAHMYRTASDAFQVDMVN